MKNFMKVTIVAVVAIAAAIAGYMAYSNQELNPLSNLMKEDIESIAACESVGWWNNDGNCVNNGKGDYFCKTDSWTELTDCKL